MCTIPSNMPTTQADSLASSADFRPATRRFLAERDSTQRKGHGQYFTPRGVRARLLDLLTLAPGIRVLDPGAGSGEFLLDVLARQPAARVSGWEIDPELVRLCQNEHALEGVSECNALERPVREEFDLVVGNPPYYEVRGDPDLCTRYADVISGRPNVFSMFFRVGLDALRPGGRLAFVVPPSMNNGAYFEALRRWLLDRAEIEHLVLLDDPNLFDGAQQSVMVIVLRKGTRGSRNVYWADLGAVVRTPLFMEHPDLLAEKLDGMHTLASMGMGIRTGRCVWNQRKEDLRRMPGGDAVPLVWAHNITDATEVVWDLEHPKRPQFVVETNPNIGPAIIVNRITGTVGKGTLRAALVAKGHKFIGENHVNVVQHDGGLFAGRVDYERVLQGLRHERATAAVRLLTGNTQLSATELAHLVPILERSTSENRPEDRHRRAGAG